MATKLTTENINIIENQLLDCLELWETDADCAKMTVAYIGGIRDMANAVRDAIRTLGGE